MLAFERTYCILYRIVSLHSVHAMRPSDEDVNWKRPMASWKLFYFGQTPIHTVAGTSSWLIYLWMFGR